MTAWGGNVYAWTRENRMLTTTGTGINRSYAYTADGERILDRNNLDSDPDAVDPGPLGQGAAGVRPDRCRGVELEQGLRPPGRAAGGDGDGSGAPSVGTCISTTSGRCGG